MQSIPGKIFIGYRRKVSTWQALSVFYALHEVHHRDVWMDRELIAGEDWEEKILAVLDSSHHFILILAHKSLDGCIRKNDNFRKEIEFALESKKNIVPLFFDFNWTTERNYLRKAKKWARLPIAIRDLAKKDGKDMSLKEFKEVIGALNSSSLKGTKAVRVKDVPSEEKKQILNIVGTSVIETSSRLAMADKGEADDISSSDYFSDTAKYLNYPKSAAAQLIGFMSADLQVTIRFREKTGLGSAYDVRVTNASQAPITISDVIIHARKNESVAYSILESRYIQLGSILPIKLHYSDNLTLTIPLYFVGQELDKKTPRDDIKEFSIVDSFGNEFIYGTSGKYIGVTKR